MYGRRYDGLAVVVDICSSDHGDDVVESSKEQGFRVSNCRETRMLAFHVTFEDFVNLKTLIFPHLPTSPSRDDCISFITNTSSNQLARLMPALSRHQCSFALHGQSRYHSSPFFGTWRFHGTLLISEHRWIGLPG